jgi:CO/xanthine dehydrogenase Mo-binding subunit
MESFGHQGRLEDERMLKGAGRYVSDWRLPKEARGFFLARTIRTPRSSPSTPRPRSPCPA